MDTIAKKIFIALMTSSLLLASSISSAKQVEIGIGAIAVDANIIGKGKFVVNDTVDEGDGLKTGDKGNTTILFNDESMLTLGPGAHASVEVYEEAKEGKPGRSIIRVHTGQFRYFPGDILENGGSQFVAVGDQLIGKIGIASNGSQNQSTPKNNSAFPGDQSQSPNTSNSSASEDKGDQGPLGSNTETTTENSAEDIAIGNDENPAPQEQPNDTPNQDTDNNDTANPPGNIQLADTGSLSTGSEGGTGGAIFKEHPDEDPFHAQSNNQGGVLANSNTPAPEPTTPDSDNDTPQGAALITQLKGIAELVENDKHQDITFLKKGIAAFAESGLSGTVKNGQGSFNGSADIYTKYGKKIGFLTSTTKNKNAKSLFGKNTNPGKAISFATSETLEAIPTYEVPVYTVPTIEAAVEAPTAPVGRVGRVAR